MLATMDAGPIRRAGGAVVAALALLAACTSPRAADAASSTEIVAHEPAAAGGAHRADDASVGEAARPAGDPPAGGATTAPVPAALARSSARFAGGSLPVYPEISRRRGEQGTVVVAVDVTERGEVQGIAIASSSGVARLDEAVLAAARTWTFWPRTGDRGVDHLSFRFVFRLEKR
jgi:protein TonB